MIFFGVLHPGYAINDDLKVIAIAAGYPTNNPAPFLVHINVLLGFVMVRLYALHTALNWLMLLFGALNFLSVWALLYIVLSGPMSRRSKVIGGLIILACDAYFALNITFTSAASLACFAGLCLIFSSARSSIRPQKMPFCSGIALILMGSLIRIEMLALALVLTIPALIFIHRLLNIKSLITALIITAIFVTVGYAFDKLYVRANPRWHAYYVYNSLREMIHDTHRLENMGVSSRRIGWSGNDQELFARWFFPDAGIYSLDHLSYLVNHVPAASQNASVSATTFFARLGSSRAIVFLLAWVSLCLWTQVGGFSKRAALALMTVTMVALAENLGLTWAYKDPYYHLLSSMANAVVLEVLILSWLSAEDLNRSADSMNTSFRRIGYFGFILMVLLAAGVAVSQSLTTSSTNLNKQTAYQRILEDIKQLQLDGRMAQNPLIISPAHGLPWEWSNPFTLGFPNVEYLDTGWITFAPSYEEALQSFGIQSLPDALYQKDNIYLMTESIFKGFLARYYEEHENMSVDFQIIYEMPNNYHIPLYDGLELYKVVRIK